jgi:hypothetical protein
MRGAGTPRKSNHNTTAMKFAGGAAAQHCIQRPCARTNASRESVDKAIAQAENKNKKHKQASATVWMHTTALTCVVSVNDISHASDADGLAQQPLGVTAAQARRAGSS